MKKKFRVVYAIEFEDGRRYDFGQVVELTLEETAGYEHALIAIEPSAVSDQRSAKGEEEMNDARDS